MIMSNVTSCAMKAVKITADVNIVKTDDGTVTFLKLISKTSIE